MIDTDYAAKPVFVKNFWTSFQGVLKPASRSRLQEFAKCDFSNIAKHLKDETAKRKALTIEVRLVTYFSFVALCFFIASHIRVLSPSQEKKKLKADKEAEDQKYKFALWNGRPEAVCHT